VLESFVSIFVKNLVLGFIALVVHSLRIYLYCQLVLDCDSKASVEE
jgi:hypothetical protein